MKRTWQIAGFAALAWVVVGLSNVAVNCAVIQCSATYRVRLVGLAGMLAATWLVLTPVIAMTHRLLRERRAGRARLVLSHVVLASACAVADTVIWRGGLELLTGTTLSTRFAATLLFNLDYVAARYVAILVATEAYLAYRALLGRDEVARRLSSQLTRARLDYLDAQLQPHFLFNSLGAVAELAHDAPQAAVRVLRNLVAMLRFTARTTTEEISVADELEAIQPYLDIQRTRFTDWLTIVEDIPPDVRACQVPPFILQPLVENAVRHGLERRKEPGTITIAAQRVGRELVIRVSDNGAGLEPWGTGGGGGIGLRNLQERLATLYGSAGRLRLIGKGDGSPRRGGTGTMAELRLPARSAEAAHARESSAPIDDPVPIPNEDRAPLGVVGVAAVWAVIGLFWVQQNLALYGVRHQLTAANVRSAVAYDLAAAAWWIVLTLAILRVSTRWPAAGHGLWQRAGWYAIACIPVATLHVFLTWVVTGRQGPFWGTAFTSQFVGDFLLYWVVVGAAHRRRLIEWLREREETMRHLREELAAAQSRASSLHASPHLLMETLDQLASIVLRDEHGAERVLARLADYLRLALSAPATDGNLDGDEMKAAMAALQRELRVAAAG